jgi:transaldolase
MMGCHIATAPADVLTKLPALGTLSAAELSLAAVKVFREDAVPAALRLSILAARGGGINAA